MDRLNRHYKPPKISATTARGKPKENADRQGKRLPRLYLPYCKSRASIFDSSIHKFKLSKEMLEPHTEKAAGWKEWLRTHEIYDANLNEDALYLRYLKLCDITFPLVAEDEWKYYF